MELKSMAIVVTLMIKLAAESIAGWNQAELREIPRMAYSWSDFWNHSRYGYYGDTIIINNTIYRMQEGEYRKEGTVGELVGLEENPGVEWVQYENLLVANLHRDEEFRVYDTDTWDYYVIADHAIIWCVYQGHLLYLKEEKLCCVNLTDGKKREFDILNLSGDENLRISRFGIREDGKMAVGKFNEESGHQEIWLLELKENGELEEKKIWEGGWRHGYWLDFNRYGVVLAGDRSYMIGDSRYEVVVIREDGESRMLDPDLLDREFIFLDDGYLVSGEPGNDRDAIGDWIPEIYYSSISLYDYEGNKAGTYQMVSHELIGQGYYLEKLIYDDGKLTGFYAQEDTGRLYISQVQIGES